MAVSLEESFNDSSICYSQEDKETLDLMLRLQQDFDPRNLREACAALTQLVKHESCVQLMEDYHAHVQVLDMMENLTYHADIQRTGFDALADMMAASEKLRELIQKKNIHSDVLDIISKHHKDVGVQEAAIRTIIYLAMSREICQIFLEEDVLEVILSSMNTFRGDAKLQMTSCQALSQILSQDVMRQVEFVDGNHHQSIMETISKHLEDPDVLVEAFHLLALLSHPEECYDVLLQETHKCLLGAMKQYPESANLQKAGSTLLRSLAKTFDSQQLLEVNGASKLVLQALHNFPSDGELQTVGLSTLNCLAEVMFKSMEAGIREDCMQTWLESVFTGLTSNLDNPRCQEAGCVTVSLLLQKQPELLRANDDQVDTAIDEIEDDGNGLDNAVLASLRVYGKADLLVFISSCRAIYVLGKYSAVLRENLMDKGAYMDVQMGMRIHANHSTAQAAACQAIMGLCLFSMNDKIVVARNAVHDDIFAALFLFSDNLEVLEAGIGAVACLADVPFVRHQCMVIGIHELILQSMVGQPDNCLIQELSLEALAALSTAEGMTEILCEADTLTYTVETMAHYAHHEGIQQKGSILLQALVAEQKIIDDECIATQVAKALVAAMRKFHEDPCVLVETCVAIQLLAENSREVSVVLEASNAHAEFFYILEHHADNEVLVELACGCLYVLCCKWDLKNSILLWASKQNMKRGVEVLVELGANINHGEGEETPLCQACLREDVEMVQLFLKKQGSTDIHLALQISLEKQNDTLVGLLLQHMGHDKEGGAVSWNGFHLNRIEPSWLYPTFLGEKAPPKTVTARRATILATRIRQTRINRAKRLIAVKSLLNAQGKGSFLMPVLRKSVLEDSGRGDSAEVESLFRTSSFGKFDAADAFDETRFSPHHEPNSRLWQERRSISLSEGVIPIRRLSLESNSSDVMESKLSTRRKSSASDDTTLKPVQESQSYVSMRRKSLSSANLPINPEDPRCLAGLRAELSSNESLAIASNTLDDESAFIDPLTQDYDAMFAANTRESMQAGTGTASGLSSPANQVRLAAAHVANFNVFYTGSDFESSDFDTENELMDPYMGERRDMPDVVPDQRYSSRESPRISVVVSSPPRIPSINESHDIRILDFSNNNLMDVKCLCMVEARLLDKYSCIEKLDLSSNKLTSFPSILVQKLPELQHLDLKNNCLKKAPLKIFTNSKLSVLDLSHNQISEVKDHPDDTSYTLSELNLSHNALEYFPSWFSAYTPVLSKLYMNSNKIKELPKKALGLKRLSSLDLSHNNLKNIPAKFLEQCPALEIINLSHNQLVSLPEDLGDTLTHLSMVKLSHNSLAQAEPQYIPKLLLQLPWLRTIDLCNNGLTGLPPPSQWKSQGLKEVLVSHNKIKKLQLTGNIHSWQKLERLAVAHNKLTQIPKEVGKLSTLTSLDFSYNKGITTIPDDLGKLVRLWEFPLEGLKLDLDDAILRGRTKDIIGFLNQKLKKAVPYHRIKLMFVGYGGRGKSTLLARLKRQKLSKKQANVATAGVKVNDWKIQVRWGRKNVDFCFSTWDFAGQEEFYSTHPCFLTGRSLFLVVFDISRGPEEVQTLRPWLLTIQALAPNCPVIVVGTHLDKVHKDSSADFIEDMWIRVRSLCNCPGFPEIKGYIGLCGTEENEDIEKLRKLIIEVIESSRIKGQSICGQMIPYSYLRLEELFQEEAKQLRENRHVPVVLHSRVLQLIREHRVQLDENELAQAVRFLHETGVLLHYDDPANQLRDMYFVEPEWLCKIMAQVVTVREINPFISPKGELRASDLNVLYSRTELPECLIPQYQKLLEKFEVALPISNTHLLIPCKVPVQRPTIHLPVGESGGLLHRHYEMPYIPIGLWSRLIIRLHLFSKNMLGSIERPLMSASNEYGPEIQYWREGIYVKWSQEAFFLVEPLSKGADVINISVPQTKCGYRILGMVCDHLDDLIEEWFPGLIETDPMMGRPLIQRLIPCVLCTVSPANHFTLDDLIIQSEITTEVRCSNHPDQPVPIQRLAPDVMLADLDDRFIIDHSKFDFNPSPDYVLGDGSFGSVYKANYKDKPVAVKIFNQGADIHPHRLLRQEVTVLRQLQHPSLVSMEGVGFKPARFLVMELAPHGSLASLLNEHHQRLSNKQLQHKIAVQVSDGLQFLHENKIVYRDLKPDNILIFSLALNNAHNAKIADYGISKFATHYGLRAPEGTPGYRAPEVIRGITTYNTEVDIYSLGILLYEMVTGGKKPFAELEFRAELDEAVMKGRQLPPITQHVAAWPDLQELILHCMEQVPQHRPTAKQVYKWLSSPDLISLKKTYPLMNNINVESSTVRTFTHNREECCEIWFAGGEKSTTVLSWIDPFSTDPNASIQGMVFSNGRALSIVAVGHKHVLVGTQNCHLCVCDVSSKPYRLSHCMPALDDAILSLAYQPPRDKQHQDGMVFAGLANGKLAMYSLQCLQMSKDCWPDRVVELGTLWEPLKCTCISHSRLWIGAGSKLVSIDVEELKQDLDASTESTELGCVTDSRKPKMIKCLAVGKSIWLCRRNSTVVEIWDTNLKKLKGTVDILPNIKKTDPKCSKYDCCVKSLLLSGVILWLGTADGHLVTIDTNTQQTIAVLHRYTEDVRTIVSVAKKQSGTGKGTGNVVVTSGMGFVRRPGFEEHTDTDYSHVMVWDADIKALVRYLKNDTDRRRQKSSYNAMPGTSAWKKVQNTLWLFKR